MDNCIHWPGAKTAAGYGRVNDVYAHRFIWELIHGPIQGGFHVLHRCDNPPCVNPRHLFLGTHTENMHDMIAKGRSNDRAKGHYKGTSKLSDEEREGLLKRIRIGRPGARKGKYRGNTRELALEYKISEASIYAYAKKHGLKRMDLP